MPPCSRLPLLLHIPVLHRHRHLKEAYRCLSQISVMNEYLTFKAKYLRGGRGCQLGALCMCMGCLQAASSGSWYGCWEAAHTLRDLGWLMAATVATPVVALHRSALHFVPPQEEVVGQGALQKHSCTLGQTALLPRMITAAVLCCALCCVLPKRATVAQCR